jgi:hypothetical protein
MTADAARGRVRLARRIRGAFAGFAVGVEFDHAVDLTESR